LSGKDMGNDLGMELGICGREKALARPEAMHGVAGTAGPPRLQARQSV